MADEQAAATTWMFQYNPTEYKLDDELKKKLIEPWTIYWGRSLAQLGERIYFMRSGGQRAAITAVGRIASTIREDLNQSSKYLRYWVDVVYDAKVEPPLTRPEMLRDDVLPQYGPNARGEFRANFALPSEVVARTERLMSTSRRRQESVRPNEALVRLLVRAPGTLPTLILQPATALFILGGDSLRGARSASRGRKDTQVILCRIIPS